jgi:hypothetical protein
MVEQHHKLSGLLPGSVVETVHRLQDKIEDVRNGLLLRRDLATALDQGQFPLQLKDGYYSVVALSRAFKSLDGVLMLDENQRVIRDGTSWWESNFPRSDMVAFHLEKSVLANMVAAGCDDPSNDFDGNECHSALGESADDRGSHVSETKTPCRGKRTEDKSSGSDTHGRSATLALCRPRG